MQYDDKKRIQNKVFMVNTAGLLAIHYLHWIRKETGSITCMIKPTLGTSHQLTKGWQEDYSPSKKKSATALNCKNLNKGNLIFFDTTEFKV